MFKLKCVYESTIFFSISVLINKFKEMLCLICFSFDNDTYGTDITKINFSPLECVALLITTWTVVSHLLNFSI